MNERNDVTAEDEFAEKAKRLFDESVDGLDGETLSRLNRSRPLDAATRALAPTLRSLEIVAKVCTATGA